MANLDTKCLFTHRVNTNFLCVCSFPKGEETDGSIPGKYKEEPQESVSPLEDIGKGL